MGAKEAAVKVSYTGCEWEEMITEIEWSQIEQNAERNQPAIDLMAVIEGQLTGTDYQAEGAGTYFEVTMSRAQADQLHAIVN